MRIKKKQKNTNSYFKMALQGGDEILKRRTATTLGLRFPADLKTGTEGRYEFKLYDGSAGIGIVLLDLYSATGDSRYIKTVEEISYGLVISTPESDSIANGLYSGFAGVGLFHLACARVLKDQRYLDYAIHAGNLLSQTSHVDTDLFRGAAGTGWLFLALYYATHDASFLEHAKKAASFLEETRIDFGGMFAWPVRDRRQPLPPNDQTYGELATQTHTGLAHGAAGICLFLLELFHLTKDPATKTLLDGAFDWLNSRSFRIRNGTAWPRSDEHRVIQDHWCHGSTGISHAYLARHRLLKDPSALEIAESAAHATWNSLADNHDEPFCHCHGLTGAIELFLDMADETGSEIWTTRAQSIANRMKNRAAVRRDALKPEGGGPSLGLGTGGIVRQMLRLSGYPVFPILTMNRDPILLRSTKRLNKKAGKKFSSYQIPAELLPPGGIRFKNDSNFLVVGQLQPNDARSIVKQISNCPAGDSYFQALDEVKKSCHQWSKRYGSFVNKEALTPAIMGRVLREIAGIVLHPEGNASNVKRAAKQLTAGAISALEVMFQRLETDRQGVLAQQIGGRLTRIQVLGSDPHFGGHRVVSLLFENGAQFLYKGRSVAIDRELAGASAGNDGETLAEKCREWLRPAFANAQLPTHRIFVAGPKHGYVEQINSTDIVTFPLDDELNPLPQSGNFPLPQVSRLKEHDEKRFWYSAGLLAGYAFSLGVFDLHSENVVSGITQSTPLISIHAVDLEMAFGNVIDLEDTQLLEGPRWGVEVVPHSHSPLSLPSLYCGLNSEDWVIEITSDGPKPVTKPWKAVNWIWPHLAQNSDGSFGYTKHVCTILRGFADQWLMVQAHAKEIADHLKEKLTGASMRIVLNPTRSYFAALLDRKLGGFPIAGIAMTQSFLLARPLVSSEIKQLDRFDIPYYFRILGEDGNIYWIDQQNRGPVLERSFPEIKTVTPFWSVVENQAEPNRLVRAVVDIVWQIVPKGPFDFHEPDLGIRVVRTESDNRVVIIVVLDQKRLVCKVASEGKIEWWLE